MDTTRTFVCALAAMAGIWIAAAAVMGWRFPTESAPRGTDLQVIATPPGELELEPAGAVLSARGLRPGSEPAGGTFSVRNIAGGPVRVSARALPSTRRLDRVVWLELTSDGHRLGGGPLRALRTFGGPGLGLGRGERREIEIRALIPPSEGRAGETGLLDVTLEFRVSPARGEGT